MAVHPILAKVTHYALSFVVLNVIRRVSPDYGFLYFSCTANFILYALLASFTYDLCKHWYNDETIQPDKKAVLITGCDTGFGHHLAKRLDSRGFYVFASCLFPDGEGAKELKKKCSDRLQTFFLDVTKDESVEEASNFVKHNLKSNVLWAVVNNAGISKGFSTDFSSIDDFKATLDVNALGPVRVTKAFLPLLKISRGRIINVTSYAARVSSVDVCAYVMSKCAARGFTECLSLEMKVWGIYAISIEPEFFKTEIINPKLLEKRMESEARNVSEEILSVYGEEYLTKLKKFIVRFVNNVVCSNISIVVDNMEEAITKMYPEHAYKPRRNIFMRMVCYTLESMPFKHFETLSLFVLKIFRYPVPKGV